MFEDDTYVVLDIPDAEWVSRILELRRKWDPWRASMPVEITIAGSGGVGPLEPGQDPAWVFDVLGRLASDIGPLSVRFESVQRFAGTALFYLEPLPAEPLIGLHKAVAESGIRFKPSNFPFVPHCTIANLRSPAQDGLQEVQTLAPPADAVVLHSMSLYSVRKTECRLLRRGPLGLAH